MTEPKPEQLGIAELHPAVKLFLDKKRVPSGTRFFVLTAGCLPPYFFNIVLSVARRWFMLASFNVS